MLHGKGGGDVGGVVAGRPRKSQARPKQQTVASTRSLLQTSGSSGTVSGNAGQRHMPSRGQRMRFGSLCRLLIRKKSENNL
jgi:hypothetical protein